MKHLKEFEAKKEYNIGDIVVFKFKRGVGRYDLKVGTIKEKSNVFDNWCTITDLDNTTYSDLSVPVTQVIKLASQKDINNYMLLHDINKYNL